MKITLAICGLAAAFFLQTSHAGDLKPAAKAIAEKYIALLGCERREIQPNAILHVTDGDQAYGLKSYYLIGLNADMNCSEGTGSVATSLIIVGNASGDVRDSVNINYVQAMNDLRVRPELSSPTVVLRGSPRYIKSLYEKNGQLWATGLDYDKSDAQCCPTLLVTYRISLVTGNVKDDLGNARVADMWSFEPTASQKQGPNPAK